MRLTTRLTGIVLLSIVSFSLRAQQVAPTWESLNQREYPQWFSDAKLGIFIHWGLYSVPAYAGKEGYSEWLYKGLLSGDTSRKRIMSLYADTSLDVREIYGQLTHYWHAELWDPQAWARLFKASGARYVLLVTKHHDGYSLWDDPFQPEWNSTTSGPRRNIVEELTHAVRAEDLRMCFYYSLPEWSHPLHRWTIDPDSTIGLYVTQYMIPQFKHLVSQYRPDAIFVDGDWDFTPEQLHSTELISWYYNTVGSHAIVNDRWGKGTPHGFRTPEYSAGISDTSRPWAECRGIGRSFGLNRNEDLSNYITDCELIQHFCQLVAHGGGLTLNVGPSADGHIPFIQQERLLALGQWLQVNGEAIYGSRPWHTPCQRTHSSAPLPTSRTLDFDWVRNAPLKSMPVDHFSISWEGDVLIPEEGTYTLRVEGDDEVSVYLHDDEPLLHYNHAWADNPASQTTLHLPAGTTHLRVAYTEKELEATVHLLWRQHNDQPFEPIPANWHGIAFWERTIRCFTRQADTLYIIEFERPSQQLSIPNMPHIQPAATIQLLGTSTPLPWQQQPDGTLTIHCTDIDPQELNALQHAWVFRIKP